MINQPIICSRSIYELDCHGTCPFDTRRLNSSEECYRCNTIVSGRGTLGWLTVRYWCLKRARHHRSPQARKRHCQGNPLMFSRPQSLKIINYLASWRGYKRIVMEYWPGLPVMANSSLMPVFVTVSDWDKTLVIKRCAESTLLIPNAIPWRWARQALIPYYGLIHVAIENLIGFFMEAKVYRQTWLLLDIIPPVPIKHSNSPAHEMYSEKWSNYALI